MYITYSNNSTKLLISINSSNTIRLSTYYRYNIRCVIVVCVDAARHNIAEMCDQTQVESTARRRYID